MPRMLALSLLLIGFSAPVSAQAVQNTCGTTPAAADAAFVGWDRPAPIGRAIVPGSAVRIPLKLGVRFPGSGKRQIKLDAFGGSARLTIATAGDYAVALSQGAWLDVVSAGKPRPSIAHRHGPPCSTMRKIVTFRLAPGTYDVQIGSSATRDIVLQVIRAN